MAFNARVSDPRFGGTYMTMLNTVANLGGTWPTTAALWFVDTVTWKTCIGAKTEGLLCNDKSQAKVHRLRAGSLPVQFNALVLIKYEVLKWQNLWKL